MIGFIQFWLEEIPIRVRSWFRARWWPSRIRQLEMERSDWKHWCMTAEVNLKQASSEVRILRAQRDNALRCYAEADEQRRRVIAERDALVAGGRWIQEAVSGTLQAAIDAETERQMQEAHDDDATST